MQFKLVIKIESLFLNLFLFAYKKEILKFTFLKSYLNVLDLNRILKCRFIFVLFIHIEAKILNKNQINLLINPLFLMFLSNSKKIKRF